MLRQGHHFSHLWTLFVVWCDLAAIGRANNRQPGIQIIFRDVQSFIQLVRYNSYIVTEDTEDQVSISTQDKKK